MRKIFLLLLIFLKSYTAGAQNGWSGLTTNTSLNLLDIHCLSSDTLFVFGDDGVLLTSYDGGNNFDKKMNGTAAIYTAGYFKDIDTGFAGTGGGNIIRTVNRGVQWSNTGGCTCFIKDICFCNSSIGLYSSLSGVHRTTDGGSTWTTTAIASAGSPDKLISLGDSIFVGYEDFSFLKSTDGGLNFTSDTVHHLSQYPISGMSFIDSQNGFIITSDGSLYKTYDQGSSWSLSSTVNLSSTIYLDFLDSMNGFLVSGSLKKNIYKTLDGGHNWILDFTASDPIELISHHGSTVYACGQGGIVLKKNASLIGVDEIAGNEFGIYPNPVYDNIRIRSRKNFQSENYKILDLTGKEILNGKISDSEKIDVSNLMEGFYILKIDRNGAGSFQISRQN